MICHESNQSIVAVTTKRQIIFPFSEITIQNNGNQPSFGRENREIWRLVVTATVTHLFGEIGLIYAIHQQLTVNRFDPTEHRQRTYVLRNGIVKLSHYEAVIAFLFALGCEEYAGCKVVGACCDNILCVVWVRGWEDWRV